MHGRTIDRRAAQRGVSLIEAVVAMAVMAFGMMAIVALQSTMRLNSDVAKQRSEAVRIAEEAIEAWRGFAVLPVTAGMPAYGDITSTGGTAVTGYTTNTSYLLTRTVTDVPTQGYKSLQAVVSWQDRGGTDQSVTLSTIVAGADPRLSGVLSLEPTGAPLLQPMGRSPVVPRTAVDIGDGTSGYVPPPGAPPGIVWVFDNLTGVITSICTVPTGTTNSTLLAGDISNCVDEPSFLLRGFVRFSPGPTPNSVNPLGTQIDFGMSAVGVGTGNLDGECFVDPVLSPPATFTAYICRVLAASNGTWTGRTVLGVPLDLALHDVCRYSPGGTTINRDHPLLYVNLSRSLDNQNFLVVDQAVTCPTPVAAPTQAHQPPL